MEEVIFSEIAFTKWLKQLGAFIITIQKLYYTKKTQTVRDYGLVI